MTSQVAARRAGIALGAIYVLLGVAETVRLLATGDGGVVFWLGTLGGGGALVLVGAVLRPAARGRRLAAVLVGAALGLPATAWTVVVPVLAITVIVLTIAAQPERVSQTASTGGP